MRKNLMPRTLNYGDTVYAGYPTVMVKDFYRNSKGKLKFGNVKELLWGDWISVRKYDYRNSNNADIRNHEEELFVDQTISNNSEMVQVRVRGRSGYMHRYDIEDNQLLEVVFIDVGQGDGALLVTPDDKKFVIDAGVSDNMYRYLKWRFSGFKKSMSDFDGLIITHPDLDHYNGFFPLVDDPNLEAENVWLNGLMEQFRIDRNGIQSSTSNSLGETNVREGQLFIDDLIQTDEDVQAFLSNKNRWVKQTSKKAKKFPKLINSIFNATTNTGDRRFKNISMLSTKHGAIENGKSYLPGFNPSDTTSCEIEVVGPIVEQGVNGNPCLRSFSSKPKKVTKSIDIGKTKNGHSILFRLKYKDFTLFFGGDLNSSAEMFLLVQSSNQNVYSQIKVDPDSIIDECKDTFQCDVTKACHHGSADFTDIFLATMNPSATVISSGDGESHAHPRSDTLGTIGKHSHGNRSLIFSTELSRSTMEYTDKKDTPWGKGMSLQVKAANERDPVKKRKLTDQANELFKEDKKLNVTVYGAINLRSDGEKVVLSYMLEKPSETNRWDVYTLEKNKNRKLEYRKADSNSKASKKRIKEFNSSQS